MVICIRLRHRISYYIASHTLHGRLLMEERGVKILQWIMLLFTFIGIFLGYLYIDQFSNDVNLFLVLYVTFLAFFIGLYLHVILHEIGHLICGLRTGYRFVALCILNVTIVKNNGKLKIKRYRIPGAGGGCMLSPPDMKNGTYPIKLYISGGLLMNFLIVIVCFGAFYYLAETADLWARAFLIIGLVGTLLGVLNLVPSNISLPSDGYILFTAGKKENDSMLRGFWSCLNIQKMDVEDVRPREIPVELFNWVENDSSNVYAIETAYRRYRYILDKQELDQAGEMLRSLYNNLQNISDIQKESFHCDLLFHEMIEGCRQEEIDRLYTKQLQKYMKFTRTEISTQRVLYAYARLVLKDTTKTKEHLDLFNKACTRSIWSGGMHCERDMIALIDKIADERGIV